VVYSWVLFAQFGINFFDYAELSDFTLAAFRAGVTTVFSIACCLGLAGVMIWASGRRETNFTARLVWSTFGTMALVIVGLGALTGWSDAKSRRFLSESDIVLYLLPTAPSDPLVPLSGSTSLIGRTNQTFFVFDRNAKAALAIPTSRIHHVEYRRILK